MDKNCFDRAISEADELYAGRADCSMVVRSVELLGQVGSECYEIAWRLSRACFFLGQETPLDARALHRRGVVAGRRVVGMEANRVEGHFWAGVNLALLAQLEGSLSALVHVCNARRALRRAGEIDRGYHGAGPLRVRGRLEHKLPRWLGGGAAKARAYYEEAIRLAPTNTVTRIYFAELLLETGEVTRARDELEYVLTAPFDPDWAFEIERDRRLARDLIAKLDLDSRVARE